VIAGNLISSLHNHQKYNFLNYGMNSKYGFAQAGQTDHWIQLQQHDGSMVMVRWVAKTL
jgi:hypothetical protein